MKKIQTYLLIAFSIIGVLFSSCSLTTDLEEMYTDPLPNLENTGGDAGGTGGSNPPPPPG